MIYRSCVLLVMVEFWVDADDGVFLFCFGFLEIFGPTSRTTLSAHSDVWQTHGAALFGGQFKLWFG